MVYNALNYEPKPEKRYAIRKTTIVEDVHKVRYSKACPFASWWIIKADVSLGICDGTILRGMLDQNFNARSPRKEPLLGKRHRKNRFRFAKSHLN